MKVCILGPVYTSKYFGGVATFTEGLAGGFKECGHEILIITDYAEQKYTSGGVEIVATFDKPSRKNIIMPLKIAKKVLEFQADIVITSLEYGLANRILKYKNFKGHIFHYLHGFPIFSHDKIKYFIVAIVSKYISIFSDTLISNSEFTAMINKEINCIEADTTMDIYPESSFLKELEKFSNLNLKEKNTVLYAGRLIKNKNVDKIIKAYGKSKLATSLLIFGDGPEKDYLKSLASKIEKPIIFKGKIPMEQLAEFYLRSELFISLNSQEPLGITYLEALAANCKVISPHTGGQVGIAINFLDRFKLLPNMKEETIAQAMDIMLEKEITYYSADYWIDKFSYKKLVKEIETYMSCNIKMTLGHLL